MINNSLIANIIIVILILSIIIVTAEDEEGSEDWTGDDGEFIIWPEGEPYHGEWNNEIIPVSGGGTDSPLTYNDHDFEVEEYATSGLIVVDNFQILGFEDVDIKLFGAALDDNGDRVVVATSTSTDPEEIIYLDGTPDPIRLDDFDKGGNGTWTLRVYNVFSATIAATYDATIDIYYEGAEIYISEED